MTVIEKIAAERHQLAKPYVCRWCGERVQTRESKQRHQGRWCPADAKRRYRQALEQQLEDLAAELGEVRSCQPGPDQRRLLALRRKARLAGVRNIGPVTARGWARHVSS